MKSDDNMIGDTNEAVTANRAPMKIIIAGGGTGGHIFPALAIAAALKKQEPDIELLFVGAKGRMEMEKIPEAGYAISGLTIAGYNRSSLIKNISLPFKLVKSFREVRRIFKKFAPGAVIGVGGYSSFPVLRFAQVRRIPSFLHESNSLPGKTNTILGRGATKIFVATGGMEKYFPAAKIVITGNPVRDIFLKVIPRQEALAFFGLQPGVKTIFVLGGSLGARSINNAIQQNIDSFKKNNLQLIWQTGKTFAAEAAREAEKRNNIWTNAFITRMEYAYAAADVVVARSGAMTIAELGVVGKAAVFVPYPFASEDHQAVNAMNLVQQEAALMIRDGEVNSQLMATLLQLIGDENKIRNLEKNISKTGRAHADENIATEILRTLKK